MPIEQVLVIQRKEMQMTRQTMKVSEWKALTEFPKRQGDNIGDVFRVRESKVLNDGNLYGAIFRVLPGDESVHNENAGKLARNTDYDILNREYRLEFVKLEEDIDD